MEGGNAENCVDRKHTRKVEAERRRRGEINERIEVIRCLLGLNVQSPKALIERNRRRLERRELQKLEKCLVKHGKLSDVHLLDTTVAVLKAKSTVHAKPTSAFKAVFQKGTTLQTRAPLQELDSNRAVSYSQHIFPRKTTEMLQFPENLDFQPASAEQRKAPIWRPWESENRSKFVKFR